MHRAWRYDARPSKEEDYSATRRARLRTVLLPLFFSSLSLFFLTFFAWPEEPELRRVLERERERLFFFAMVGV